jgi:phospholipid/cholesterol/gamma-HCH transport system substrate-binding protein
MEREANYVAVGAFILLVMAMAVGFVLWYTDANDSRDYDLYEIYFTGSVSGLDRGSPVRYLGVDVGRVRRLSIDKQDASRIVAVAEIDREAPITAATRASLGLQGVTGLLFINLKEVPNVDKTVPLSAGERYPVIPSIASDFDVFLSSLPELMGRANDLLLRVGRVFSDENLNGLADTVKSLRAATAGLPQTSQNIAKLVDDLRGTVKEIDSAAQSLRGISEDARPEVKNALARLTETANNLAQASARMDRFTQKSEAQLGQFSEQGLFELERLVRETRSAAREFRDLSRSLRENPSQILYEPPESGVEIPQ